MYVETKVFRKHFENPIRRITIANLKNEFSFFVGQILDKSNLEISKIERDENNGILFGSMMYVIYVKKNNQEEQPWKYIEGLPVMVEFQVL